MLAYKLDMINLFQTFKYTIIMIAMSTVMYTVGFCICQTYHTPLILKSIPSFSITIGYT